MTADELFDFIAAQRPAWWDHAACRGVGPERFFPSGSDSAAKAVRKEAKETCARCPVVAECLAHAIRVDEPEGVWGGVTAAARKLATGRSRYADARPVPRRNPTSFYRMEVAS